MTDRGRFADHGRFRMLAANALDFEHSPAATHELAVHLAGCSECRNFEAALKSDSALARRLPKEDAPERVRQVIVAAALRSGPIVRPTQLMRFGLTASIAIALLAGLALTNRAVQGPGHAPARDWVRLADISAFQGGEVSAVTTGGPGLVAVGSAGSQGEAAIWTSQDGVHWDGSTGPSSGVTGAALGSVASSGSRLVAAGLGQFWVSADGRTWVESQPMGAYANGCIMYEVVPRGPGFVAAGADVCGYGQINPIVTSSDGSTWREVPATTFDGAVLTGIASNPAGLVIVGSTASAAPGIWTSSDGRTWLQVPTAQAPASGTLLGVAASEGGFIAVGSDGSRAAAWTSTDGRSWHEVAASPALADASMTRIARTGSALIAMGMSNAGEGLAWISADGSTWSRLDTGAIFSRAQAFGAIGSTWVLFGQDSAGQAVVAFSNPQAPSAP
jgi:hypothetical protein